MPWGHTGLQSAGTGRLGSGLLPVQYVSRKPSDELMERYGSFVNGKRIVGKTSMRDRPESIVWSGCVGSVGCVLLVRISVTNSLVRPTYTGMSGSFCSD